MTHFKRASLLALAAALSLSLLSGCAKKPAETPAPSVELTALTDITDPILACAGIPGDTVMATADGLDITADRVLYWLSNYADENLQSFSSEQLADLQWDEEYDGMTLAQSLKSAALEMATLYAVLPAKSDAMGLTVAEDYLAENADVLTQMAQSMGSDELLEHYLWQYPLSRAVFLELSKAREQSVLIQEALFGENGSERPDDAQVEAYAADELGYAYRAKHILLMTVDTGKPILDADGNATGEYEPLDAATVAGKKTLAENVLSRLNGSDDPIALFDELMREYSEDGGLASNPDGYNATAGQMVEPFETAALALENGQYSGIVESVFGYHIILRLPLAETCREDYATYLATQRYHQWIDEAAPVTTAAFDALDVSAFYSRLNELRALVDAELTALEAERGDASGSASSAAPQS